MKWYTRNDVMLITGLPDSKLRLLEEAGCLRPIRRAGIKLYPAIELAALDPKWHLASGIEQEHYMALSDILHKSSISKSTLREFLEEEQIPVRNIGGTYFLHRRHAQKIYRFMARRMRRVNKGHQIKRKGVMPME